MSTSFLHLQPFACPSLSSKAKRREWCGTSFRTQQTHQTCTRLQAFKVEIEHPGGTTVLDVEEGSTVLETALDAGLELSHDCKMGVHSQISAANGRLQFKSMTNISLLYPASAILMTSISKKSLVVEVLI